MAWIDRLRSGLSRTRSGLAGTITQVLRRASKLSDEDAESLEEALIAADVGAPTAVSLVEELRAMLSRNGDDPVHALESLICSRLDGIERPLTLRSDDQPTVFLVAGVNGAGKTTTIAKLASHLRADHPEMPVTFAAADTFRAAAIEQLGIWADRIGADFIRHQSGADPSAVAFDALDHASRTGGALFLDTAGRLQTKHNLMEELKKIERTVTKKLGRGSDERLLVLDATTGQNGISQARHFHDALDLTGIVLTKVDGTAKGGVVLAIWDALRIPLTHIGVGESAGDLHPFAACDFVEALFENERITDDGLD
jgi:fused signal recognition particle receptor